MMKNRKNLRKKTMSPLLLSRVRIYAMSFIVSSICLLGITNNSYATRVAKDETSVQDWRTVKGEVTDTNGTPLPGVTVLVKGTQIGGVTNNEGKFSIKVADDMKTLVFSFIGMESKEVLLKGNNFLKVVLTEDAIGIEEVVAVGYGTQRKADLTGAVTRVDEELFGNSVKTNVAEGLQGLAAGVQVTQSSAQPGGGVNIRIRGISSINASSTPLYVIDGVAIDNTGEGTGEGDGPALDPLGSINPDDIESIDILKDASATAIYGSRGSNGVVIVTTKSGKDGKAKLSVNVSSGVQQVTKTLDMLDAQEYLHMKNLGYLNDFDGDTIATMEEYGNSFKSQGYIDSAMTKNWQDEIFKTTTFHNANVSLSGGTNGTKYFFSVGHTINNGVIRNSKFERTSLRVNLSKKLNDVLEVGQNLSFSYIDSDVIRTESDNQSSPAASVVYSALRYSPVAGDSYDENGDFLGDPSNQNLDNPIALVDDVTNVVEKQRLNGNMYLQLKPVKALTLKTILGYDFSNNRGSLYSPRTTRKGREENGIAKVSMRQNKRFVSTSSVQYTPDLGQNNNLSILGVYEANMYTYYSLDNMVTNFFSDVFRDNKLETGLNPGPPRNSKRDRSLISYLSRINYSYKGKYMFTASGRYDGSSQLTKNKWAFFPSASLAWRMSEEPFIKDVDVISNLKLRLSYGVVGNDQITSYATMRTYSPDFYVFGKDGGSTQVGMHQGALHNEDLKWEIKKQFNVGLDFGLAKGRFSGAIEYYNDRTDDLLYQKEIPSSSGFPNSWINLGSIENTGLEFSIASYNIDKKNFKWKTNFNVSFPRNKVLDLGGNDNVLAGMSTLSVKNSQILQVGKPLGQFYGYIIDGIAKPAVIDPDTGEEIRPADDVSLTYSGVNFGDYLRRDISGPDGEPDGVISNYDKVVIGNAFPDFYGSISNTFTYKNLELSFLFTGTYGNDIMNVNRTKIEWSKMVANQLATMTDAYDPITNPDGDIRQVRYNSHGPRGEDTSTRLIEDGSYLRLANTKLSLRLPGLRKIKLNNAMISISASNLVTFTNYSGYDPEVDARSSGAMVFGHDSFGYPRNRTVLLGLKFNL